MKLPEWAVRAFDQFKPMGVHGKSGPNPDQLAQWEGLKSRFEIRWAELESDKWDVPKSHPRYATMAAGLKYSPIDYIKQQILEIAIESAWELGIGKSPKLTTIAVGKLRSLNDQIADKAGELAELFRVRQHWKDKYHLSDQSMYREQNQPDPFDVFGAFELALKTDQYCAWASVDRLAIKAFLVTAAKSSSARPRPDWAALLDQATYRDSQTITGRDAGDIATMSSGTNKSSWSDWCLKLIGWLDDTTCYGLPRGFLLGCLTNPQLAALASVSFNAGPDDKINDDQIKHLKDNFFKRRKKRDD